jgi:hypothetical protein
MREKRDQGRPRWQVERQRARTLVMATSSGEPAPARGPSGDRALAPHASRSSQPVKHRVDTRAGTPDLPDRRARAICLPVGHRAHHVGRGLDERLVLVALRLLPGAHALPEVLDMRGPPPRTPGRTRTWARDSPHALASGWFAKFETLWPIALKISRASLPPYSGGWWRRESWTPSNRALHRCSNW